MADFWPEDRDTIHKVGHRASVGGRWEEIGPLQRDYLVTQGLSPRDIVVDVGCGSLRGGVHLISYLEPGHYFGVDKHIEHIIYGVAGELGLEAFKEKRPRFFVNDTFDFSGFDARPNFGIAQSLFTHLAGPDITRCLANLTDAVAPHCQLFGTFNEVTVTRGDQGVSHAHRVFHYTRDEIAAMAEAAGWSFEYIGDWGHPRGQRMGRFMPGPDTGVITLKPPFTQETGLCWVTRLPAELTGLSDSNEAPKGSPLRLFEDAQSLGEGHAVHRELRDKGEGRHSFWRKMLYFTATDGSDPNTSGHVYRIAYPRSVTLAAPAVKLAVTCKAAVAIMGTSYCGSTLVTAVMDAHSQIGGGGELHWLVDKHERGVCAVCGSACPRWTPEVIAGITAENLWATAARVLEKPYVVDSSKMKDWFAKFLPVAQEPRLITVMAKHPVRLVASFIEKARRREDMVQYRDLDFVISRLAQSYRFMFENFSVDHALRYEDFIASPGAAMAPILERLGLAYEPAMDDWQNAPHHYIGGNPGPRYQLNRAHSPDAEFVRVKYDRDGMFLDDTYKDVLTAEERARIAESDGAKYLCERFGYDAEPR